MWNQLVKRCERVTCGEYASQACRHVWWGGLLRRPAWDGAPSMLSDMPPLQRGHVPKPRIFLPAIAPCNCTASGHHAVWGIYLPSSFVLTGFVVCCVDAGHTAAVAVCSAMVSFEAAALCLFLFLLTTSPHRVGTATSSQRPAQFCWAVSVWTADSIGSVAVSAWPADTIGRSIASCGMCAHARCPG